MRINLSYTIRSTKVTPTAPLLTANDSTNLLTATHELGTQEIEVSVNNGAYNQYTGPINVGDVYRAPGYWRFRTRATAERNVSPVASSPEFTVEEIPEELNFRLPSSVKSYSTKQFLFGTAADKSLPITYTSSDESKAKVYLEDGLWMVDYIGLGSVEITGTNGSQTLSKTVSVVNDNPTGRVVNVGSGSGSLTISRSGNSLQNGDIVVIKAGVYSKINFTDIIVPDGAAKIYITTDGLVETTSGGDWLNLRNIVLDGSLAAGHKHGICIRDTSSGIYSNNITKCEFRNIRFLNVNSHWAWRFRTLIEGGEVKVYDGSPDSFSRDCLFVNIKFENSGRFAAGDGYVNQSSPDQIGGLCYNFKFIGCEGHEVHNMLFEFTCGVGIEFRECYANNSNLRNFNHVALIAVNGHANVINSRATNWYGNLIRLFAFNIVDGSAQSDPDRKALFYGNIGVDTQTYSMFEVQHQAARLIPGKTSVVDVDVFNNTAGNLGMSTPQYWGSVFIDNYSMTLGWKLRIFNNILYNTHKDKADGSDWLQYGSAPEGNEQGVEFFNNHYYETLAEANIAPVSSTLSAGHQAKGSMVENEATGVYTHDLYGNPSTAKNIGAVQIDSIVLPAVVPAPTVPVNDLSIVGTAPYSPTEVCVIARASKSAVGIKNYDWEVNGQIRTTEGGYAAAGKQSIMATPYPFPSGTVTVRFRARDYRDQVSAWSTTRTITIAGGSNPDPDPDPEPEPGTEGEARIEYQPEDISHISFDTSFDDGMQYIQHRSLDNLTKQDYIIDVDNVPSGVPSYTPAVYLHAYGGYNPSWYNFYGTFDFKIDLKDFYDVTKIYTQLNSHSSSPIKVWGSEDGINRMLIYSSDRIPEGNNSWRSLAINTEAAQNIRYIIVGIQHAEIRLNGLAIYGIKKNIVPQSGFKSERQVPARQFVDRIGTNAFLEEQNFDMIYNTAKVVRYYNDSGWIVSSWAGVTLSPDQIKLFPKTSHMWNFDAKMQSAIAHGHKILFCYKHTPDHLGQLIDRQNDEAKPTDPGLNCRDLAVTSDPHSYTHMARIAFLFAARYGSNSDIDSKWDVQYSDANPPYGMNLFEYFEVGNEPDGYWKGEDAVTVPIELAAMYSAIYDGHKGALGEGFGIKQADPNMKFSNGGFVGINLNYFKEMCLWWDIHRGPGDYPIEVLNVHNYNGWEYEHKTPVWSDIPAYALPPEKGSYIKEIKSLSDFRDKVMPDREVWITETGYDEHFAGMYSPPDISQTPRSRHKAVWILRTFLVITKYCDVITQYWYGDDQRRLQEFDGVTRQREKFMTCGYVEGITAANDRNRRPMTTYWYISSLRNDMDGYYYSHTVVEAGVQRTTESLGLTLHPELWAMAFKKDNGDSCIVIWMGSSDWKTHSTQLNVPENTVEVIDYFEHETRQVLEGNVTNLTASSGKISLTVSEYPQIVKTSNIGVGKLETPSGLKIEKGVLYWDDFNIGENITEIYSSPSEDSGFTLLQSSVFGEAKYTLPLDSDQYFRVRFATDDSFSDYSTTVSK